MTIAGRGTSPKHRNYCVRRVKANMGRELCVWISSGGWKERRDCKKAGTIAIRSLFFLSLGGFETRDCGSMSGGEPQIQNRMPSSALSLSLHELILTSADDKRRKRVSNRRTKEMLRPLILKRS